MIAIIGGGISGLALSFYLQKQGIEHVLLEAEAVPGGVMRTETAEGIPLDLGPQRIRLTGDLREMIGQVGLDKELVHAPAGLPLWVFRDGRLRKVPFTWRAALSTDLLSLGGKARLLLEPFTAGVRSGESVAHFFERKFGREAYRAFLGPLYGGLYASDPAHMKARHGLTLTLRDFGVDGSLLLAVARRGLRAREAIPTVTFRAGLGALPRALAAAAGDRVRVGTPVAALEHDGARWKLHLGGAETGQSVTANRVVLALPAGGAGRLLERVAPAATAALASLRYNPLAVVHLQARCELTGLGYQVAFGESLETRGVTWNASMFGRDGVYTAYLGGMSHPELVSWDDDRIASVAAGEFRRVTGCESRPLLVSRTAIPAWDETWDALAELKLPEGIDTCTSWSARPGIPGRLSQAKHLATRLSRHP
jgi:protoporphyrinogen/coproporphyrinogen III oxidase